MGALGCRETSIQSEFHLRRNQCDGASHPKWMLGEADIIKSLNQKPLVLSISIKAEMNFGGKGGLRLGVKGKKLLEQLMRERRREQSNRGR